MTQSVTVLRVALDPPTLTNLSMAIAELARYHPAPATVIVLSREAHERISLQAVALHRTSGLASLSTFAGVPIAVGPPGIESYVEAVVNALPYPHGGDR